jgi:hypothetical protein
MTAAYVCRTNRNISTTCFKRSGRREVVLMAYHLAWDNAQTLLVVNFSKKIHIYVTTDDKFSSGFIEIVYNAV